MNKVLVVISVFNIGLSSQDLAEARRMPLTGDLADKPMPRWRDGALVVADSAHGSHIGISTFDRNGRAGARVAFSIPGASYITVRDVARDPQGALALCGTSADPEGRSGTYVAWISAGASETHIIRTSPFVVTRVVFGHDGTIWTQGFEIRPREPGEAPRTRLADALKGGAPAFRQFDRSGKMLRALISQSEIADADALVTSNSIFEAVGDRIVWYSAVARDYLVISAAGVQRIRDLALPNKEELSGSGVNRNGVIFASSRNGSTWSVSRLDPGAQAWKLVAGGSIHDHRVPHRRLNLLGVDEDLLVADGVDSRHLRFLEIK